MHSNYDVVRYEPGLKSQVTELQSHLWSPSEALSNAYFEWKYEHNPYVDTPLIYLAMHEGKVVGMRGFFGMQWEGGVFPEKISVLYADDLVVAPAHRNRGVVHRIMTAAFEDLAKQNYGYAFNMSAGPISLLSSLASGWRSLGSMQPMTRRSRRLALHIRRNRFLTKLQVLSRSSSRNSSRWSQNPPRSLVDIEEHHVRHIFARHSGILFEEAPRCAAMAELVERIGSDRRIRHVRDREYFHWRFQNPLSRYRFLYAGEERLEGYLVLQEYTSTNSDHQVVNIVDWEASDIHIYVELLQAAINLTGTRELAIWSVSLPEHLKGLLNHSNFKLVGKPESAVQRRYVLIVRPICEQELDREWLFAGRPMLDIKNWDLRMLYSSLG